MEAMNMLLNLVVPPLGLAVLAFAWPSLAFIRGCQWLLSALSPDNMEGKVVVITGASSGIGEQLAYQYSRKAVNLVLVARRETRLRAIRDKARSLGARSVTIMAADVVKEDDCKRIINDTINQYGHLDHLVNNAGLGHSFMFEDAEDTSSFAHLMDVNFWGSVYPTFFALPHLRRSKGRVVVNASVEGWLPLPRMSLYNAAKAAVISFYETLGIEVGEEVGITIATSGLLESDMTRGRFLTEEGEVHMKEESKEASIGPYPLAFTEECAKSIVQGACKGQRYVRFPLWYNMYFLYRIFIPDVMDWAYRFVFMIPVPGSPQRVHHIHHHSPMSLKDQVEHRPAKRPLLTPPPAQLTQGA